MGKITSKESIYISGSLLMKMSWKIFKVKFDLLAQSTPILNKYNSLIKLKLMILFEIRHKSVPYDFHAKRKSIFLSFKWTIVIWLWKTQIDFFLHQNSTDKYRISFTNSAFSDSQLKQLTVNDLIQFYVL